MSRAAEKSQFLRVGDLVYCGHDAASDAFGVAERVGLIIELRKSQAHVFYADRNEIFWLPRSSLPRIRSEGIDSREFPFLLSKVLMLLEADECEILSFRAPAHMIQIAHDQVTIVTLDKVRQILGDSFLEMILTPAGRHRIETTVVLDPSAMG